MKRIKGIEIIDIIAAFITLIAFVLAVSGSVSGYVRPHHFKWIALSNNILPVTLITCAFLVVYWLTRKSWGFLIPLFSIIINTFTLLSFIQPRGEIKILPYKNEEIIKVLNYNVHKFDSINGSDEINSISKYITEESPDIICLQEFRNSPYPNTEEMSSYFKNRLYQYIKYPDNGYRGLAILTKYKIIKRGLIDFEDSAHRVIWADLSTEKGPVRVINIHLQTTSLAEKRGKGEGAFSQIRKLRDNNEKRATQAEVVRHLIDTTIHPVILCGDMNDTPLSYTYTKLKGEKLTDGFREAGSMLGGTYRGMTGLFRLDYIFHSKEFKSVRYTTPDKEWSDHKPVISELVYQN